LCGMEQCEMRHCRDGAVGCLDKGRGGNPKVERLTREASVL